MHQLVFCGKHQKETIYSLTHTFSLYIGCVFIMYDLKRWWWSCGGSKERKQQQSNQQYCFDRKEKKRISFLRLKIMVHVKNKISSIAPGKYPEKQWIYMNGKKETIKVYLLKFLWYVI